MTTIIRPPSARERVAPSAPAHNNQRRDAVVEAFQLARRIKKPETARQHLMQAQAEICAAIIAHRQHATPERYQHFVAPIQVALSILGKPGNVTTDILVSEQVLDGQEDVSETAYIAQSNQATAEAFVRALDRYMSRALYIRGCLAYQWHL